jgi:hypothetical protein
VSEGAWAERLKGSLKARRATARNGVRMRTQDYRKSGTHGKGETFSEQHGPRRGRLVFELFTGVCVEKPPLSEKILNVLDWLGLG